jgi:transcriptional regulator with XRE-family HTH domain
VELNLNGVVPPRENPRCASEALPSDTRESRYGSAVDVKRAADLYAQGWTLRQIGAELGVHWSTVSQQLQSAGITMRSTGPTAHPASTQQILELRDKGLTWNEIAEQVGMTVSGAWSRYRRARSPKPSRLGRWHQGLAVAGSDAVGRKSPHNHAQTVRNLRHSVRNAAAGARLIQAEGLDSESAADVSALIAEALKSFTGSSAASIDVSDAARIADNGLGRLNIAHGRWR